MEAAESLELQSGRMEAVMAKDEGSENDQGKAQERWQAAEGKECAGLGGSRRPKDRVGVWRWWFISWLAFHYILCHAGGKQMPQGSSSFYVQQERHCRDPRLHQEDCRARSKGEAERTTEGAQQGSEELDQGREDQRGPGQEGGKLWQVEKRYGRRPQEGRRDSCQGDATAQDGSEAGRRRKGCAVRRRRDEWGNGTFGQGAGRGQEQDEPDDFVCSCYGTEESGPGQSGADFGHSDPNHTQERAVEQGFPTRSSSAFSCTARGYVSWHYDWFGGPPPLWRLQLKEEVEVPIEAQCGNSSTWRSGLSQADRDQGIVGIYPERNAGHGQRLYVIADVEKYSEPAEVKKVIQELADRQQAGLPTAATIEVDAAVPGNETALMPFRMGGDRMIQRHRTTPLRTPRGLNGMS